MGYTQPLFIWGIMGLKNLYDTKSVIIYILGQEVEGDLKGPFMGSMFRGEFVFFSFLFLSFFGGGFFCFALYLLLIQILSQPLSLWFCYSGVMF